MTDAPTRIRAWPHWLYGWGSGSCSVRVEGEEAEYVRADLVPAMLAAERAAVIEAAISLAHQHVSDDADGLMATILAESIADMSDDAVTAARAALVEQGRREGLEAAAALVETHVYTTNGDHRQMEPSARAKDDMHHRTIAAAIRALIGAADVR